MKAASTTTTIKGAFQRAHDSLAEAGIKVAALWVDNEETTARFTAEHDITFPLGHSADAHALADRNRFSG